MKFCLIGPGIMEIPPKGWGAVESLIWDYSETLKSLGHSVTIINTADINEIIRLENADSYDVTHLHYDVLHEILPYLKAKKVLISSHYPYIEQSNRHIHDSYASTFKYMVENSHRFAIAAISQKDINVYKSCGVNPQDIILLLNGVNTAKFTCNNSVSSFSFAGVVLAKIEPRKRQFLTKNLPNVYYIGRGPFDHPNYIGEIRQDDKYKKLTNFGTMLLLSDGENGTPLAIKEGMAAGLEIIVSEYAASEIYYLPFVTVVHDDDISDENYISRQIIVSSYNNLSSRTKIRRYCEKTWDWTILVNTYVNNVVALTK